MPDVSDLELLREYDRTGSESAFATLVQRHVDLVYSAAFRQVRMAAQAEEITQAVFVILARKGAGLCPGTILEGWLYETTRLTALSFLRTERRRQFREQEAYMQSTQPETALDSTWNQLAPLLDEGMLSLGKKDRDAVMLRFFKEQSVREIAAALKITESAAQRRVLRAVEKLRRFFTKRGVVVPAAVLTAAISAHSVQAAPSLLAKTATAIAITKGATASSSTLTLIKGALKIMAWTKAKTAVAVGVIVILTAGTTTVMITHSARYRMAHLPRSTDSEEAFKQECLQRLDQGRQWGLAFRMFSADNRDQLPKSFDQTKRYFSGLSSNWEVVSSGNVRRFPKFSDTILVREKMPTRSADGAYFKVYVLVDGSAQLTRSPDGDFEAVEKKRGWVIAPGKN